jgi:hypothetical protein
MRRLIGMALIGWLASTAAALAQQGTSDLRGRVLDQQGAALPGVTILVRHEESGLFRESVSGADGTFFLSAMTPGTYEISAELANFKKYQRRGVRLEVGKTTSIDVQLEVGGVQEQVTISAEAPLVDVSSKEIGGNISAQELTDIPSFSRNFTGYLGLLPGVVVTVSTDSFGADDINVNGQADTNVNYTLDGSNNNDTANAGSGGAQARVPVESVQEFQLLTGQFDAEFGNASGAIVNAVSKQGTNQLRGSAFMFYQDDKMTSRNYFAKRDDLPKPKTRQHQWGGTLGGPIVRDKAHFFFSLERVLVDNGITINVPARPEFNRTDFEETRVWNTLVRGDHQITQNNTWGLRYLRDSSPQPKQWATTWTPSRAESETDTDWTLVGNLSSVLSPTMVNTVRVSGTREDVFFVNPAFTDNGGRQELLPPLLDYLNFDDQQSARANRRYDVAYAADETFAWFVPDMKGSHEFKFGVQYIFASLLFQNWGNQNGTFVFSHNLAFDPANPRTWPERFSIRVPGARNFYMKGHFVSGFAQDRWSMGNRLTVSAGVRYDLEIIPIEEVDNPQFSDPSKYPVDRNNLAPRIGFSYAMDKESRSALRGGFGLFFQRTPFTYFDEFINNGVYSDSFTVQFPANNPDPGPSAGRFPTDPYLTTFPNVNRALIDASFAQGVRQPNTGDVFFDNPDRHLPYARQYTLGYERQIGPSMSATVDFIRAEQRELYLRRNLNPGLRVSTGRTATIQRVDPNFVTNVWEVGNYGYVNYTALQLQLEKRLSAGWSLRGSYTYSRGRGNSDSGSNSIIETQLLDDLRLDAAEGPTSLDRPHILAVSGTYDVPKTKGLKVSGVLQARSFAPFSLTDTNFDLNRNGRTDDEWLPSGTYSGVGSDAITVTAEGGRRGARALNSVFLNMRFGYRIRMQDRRTLDAFVDVFNITDRVNFNQPSGDRRSANFLVLTSAAGPTRTVQLNLRYGF